MQIELEKEELYYLLKFLYRRGIGNSQYACILRRDLNGRASIDSATKAAREEELEKVMKDEYFRRNIYDKLKKQYDEGP